MSKESREGFPLKVKNLRPTNNNANNCQVENTLYKVDENTTNLPINKGGYIWCIYDKFDVNSYSVSDLRQKGCQYYFSSTGQIFCRTSNQLGFQGGQLDYQGTWDSWKELVIDNRLAKATDLKNFVKLHQITEPDANNVIETGIYSVDNGSRNYPSEVNTNTKGILQCFKDKHQTEVQLYIPVDTDYKGIPFTRAKKNGNWGEWNNPRSMIANKYYNKEEINNMISNGRNIQEYIKKPEKQSHSSNIDGEPESCIKPTNNSTRGTFPINGQKSGIVQTFFETGTMSYGIQYFTYINGTHKGHSYIRVRYNKNWESWKEISTPDNSMSYLGNIPTGNNANNWDKPGTCKTNTTTTNLPDNINGDEKYGTLLFLKDNGKKGTQIWSSANQDKGVYYRITNQSGVGTWKKLATVDDIPQGGGQGTFEHTETPIPDVLLISKSGYYRTNEQTQNLDIQHQPHNHQPKQVSKNGILKVLVEGTKRYCTYTPIDGKGKGQTWTCEFDTALPYSVRANPHWEQLRGDKGHLRVIDDRGVSPITPRQYWDHSETGDTETATGYAWYEWKFTGNLGGVLPGVIDSQRCTVVTVVPMNKSIDPDLTSHDWHDVNQTVYCSNGKVFYRNGLTRDTWDEFVDLTKDPESDNKINRPEVLETIRDCDLANKSGFYRTSNGNDGNPITTNLPNVDNRNGMLTHLYYDRTHQMQYWQTSVGNGKEKLYTRHLDGTSSWSSWKVLADANSQGGGVAPLPPQGDFLTKSEANTTYQRQDKMPNFFKKPEVVGNNCPDLNNVSMSCISTTDSSTSGTFPNGIDGKVGIVITTYANTAKTKGSQTFVNYRNDNSTKMYRREKHTGTWGQWSELTSGGTPQPVPPPTPGQGITEERAKELFKEELKKLFEGWKDNHLQLS